MGKIIYPACTITPHHTIDEGKLISFTHSISDRVVGAAASQISVVRANLSWKQNVCIVRNMLLFLQHIYTSSNMVLSRIAYGSWYQNMTLVNILIITVEIDQFRKQNFNKIIFIKQKKKTTFNFNSVEFCDNISYRFTINPKTL